jgi:hypothetical protein
LQCESTHGRHQMGLPGMWWRNELIYEICKVTMDF